MSNKRAVYPQQIAALLPSRVVIRHLRAVKIPLIIPIKTNREVLRLNDYLQKDFSLSYLITQGGAEIDLIIERPGARTLFVEIKSTDHVTHEHVWHLRDLSAGRADVEPICLSREVRRRKEGEVLVLPWQEAFEYMGFGR